MNYQDTRTMLQAISRTFPPSTLFRDVFFPIPITFTTKQVDIEIKKGGRRLAPFIVDGATGRPVARNGSTMYEYTPPIIKPKKIITADDVMKRGFGENVYSTITPAQRAIVMQANDIAELIEMNTRRVEWMCAELLINGRFTVQGYADNGEVIKGQDLIFEEWDQKLIITEPDKMWNNPAANIYADLKLASETISQNSGIVPTVAIMSSNVSDYILNNAAIMKWLSVPSPANLGLMSIQPRIQSPEVTRVGRIDALNLELYSYNGIYMNDEGILTKYIPDDHIVIGVTDRGKQLYGAITQLEDDGNYYTYAEKNVPKITIDKEFDTKALHMSSRAIPCPEFISDWYTIKVAGGMG